MKLQVRSTFSFGKLAQYISSGEFARQKNRILGAHIAEASKRFIMQGKVQPRLKNETIKRRRRKGVQTNTPLFLTGTLANSLKPTPKGIKGAYYGEHHLTGHSKGHFPPRNFAVIEEGKIQKPLNTLMKKFGKALKK